MNQTWQEFLQQHSAVISDGAVTGFGNPAEESRAARDGDSLYALSQFDILGISGSDAKDFLHGQLSSDVQVLGEGQYQFSSWCNIKGRVIAVFLLYRGSDTYYLLLEKSLSEKVLPRLKMFVLRSDVQITTAEQLVCLGIRGENVHARLEQLLNADGAVQPAATLRLPGDGPRSLLLGDLDCTRSLWPELAANTPAVAEAYWLEHDIRGALPWPGSQGSEAFLPQSLNLDLLGGLSFDKGCFPGQEIISRMHFRGKLKQRMRLAATRADRLPETGMRIYREGETRDCGRVVRACAPDDREQLLLAELDLALDDPASLHLGGEGGPSLELLSLPYDIEKT